ncbi:MAG: hypothetical protein HXX11_10075 [Desulfuromonadales bacterium]|nr:hypothetical protein [Desulfuromonadales bacterium]
MVKLIIKYGILVLVAAAFSKPIESKASMVVDYFGGIGTYTKQSPVATDIQIIIIGKFSYDLNTRNEYFSVGYYDLYKNPITSISDSDIRYSGGINFDYTNSNNYLYGAMEAFGTGSVYSLYRNSNIGYSGLTLINNYGYSEYLTSNTLTFSSKPVDINKYAQAPIPPSFVLMGSGVVGLFGFRRKKA